MGTEYVCAECGHKFTINDTTNSDNIRCDHCSCVVLFKCRKDTALQVEAR